MLRFSLNKFCVRAQHVQRLELHYVCILNVKRCEIAIDFD